MDISPLGLARNWLPTVPPLLKTTILSLVGKSPSSKHQDLLTELIVLSARPILGTPASLLRSQLDFNRDYGVWGRMWVAKYTVPTPIEHMNPAAEVVFGLREAVEFAIAELSPDKTTFRCPVPPLVDVQTEWTGYRSNAVPIVSPRPFNVSEREMYDRLMAEVPPHGPTILYFHGGAHCLMDPATHRLITSNLARHSQGRVLSVRHRLSPQHIFPAALLDALQVYLALLSPPPDAFHEPVAPSKIVLAGDSSGAGLAASLHLLLLTLSRHNTTVQWHSAGNDAVKSLKIPPRPTAGLALTSPYLDITRSLPSTRANALTWDFIAPPPDPPLLPSPAFPPDEIWPTAPPRAETFCIAEMVRHPLVSPVTATKEMWKATADGNGGMNLYINVGWEGVTDEAEVLARRVHGADHDLKETTKGDIIEKVNDCNRNTVVFDGYEGMPHCFAVMPWNALGRKAMRNWGRFCADAVVSPASSFPSPSSSCSSSKGTWNHVKDGQVLEKEVRLSQLGLRVGAASMSGYERTEPLSDVVVERLWDQAKEWRMEVEERLVREWKDNEDGRDNV